MWAKRSKARTRHILNAPSAKRFFKKETSHEQGCKKQDAAGAVLDIRGMNNCAEQRTQRSRSCGLTTHFSSWAIV
jgi:hypothetical protein